MAIIIPAAIGAAVPLLLLVRAIATGRPSGLSAALLLFLFVALSSLLWVSYTVSDAEIVVRQSVFRFTMPLDRVRALRATREFLAAPALSLDRIEIRTDRGMWLFVSPADRWGFVQAVQQRAPAIELIGLNTPTLADHPARLNQPANKRVEPSA
ncbi:MAG: PH domain-containing protein [Vicinamibacterales bacterium]